MFTTNNQQHSIGGIMKTTYKSLLEKRINKLTQLEKETLDLHNFRLGWYDKKLVHEDPFSISFSDDWWESAWCFSSFGQYYVHNQALAKKFLSSEGKMKYVMDKMENRKKWFGSGVGTIKELHAKDKLTVNVMTLIITGMRKENFNTFESHVNDPIFDVGSIVQFRSNIGVDAVLQENRWSNGVNYYGASSSTMKELKKKTMMVLGESPCLDGKIYASSYAYKEKVGGSRYYRILAVGDTKVYIVVEKFLKKCRTRAVKDARK
jgi:hypothetical protein